jgi:predicted ATPase
MKQREPFVSRVRLTNYRSIAGCDVLLGPLTVLIGPNGSGKSSFLDALAFLARAVETSPRIAIEERGGMNAILRSVPAPRLPETSEKKQNRSTLGMNPAR